MRGSLPFAAGAVLAGFVLIAGLLGTPFFGLGAGYWANVVGAMALALGVGFGLGDYLALPAGSPERAPSRLAILGGALVALATWALPLVARAILDRDPDSPWTATLFAGGLIALPATIVASVLAAGVRAPAVPGKKELASEDSDKRTRRIELDGRVARTLLRRFGLSMLGGLLGVALTLVALRESSRLGVATTGYAFGIALLLLGAVDAGGVGRVVAAVLAVAVVVLALARPSEVQSKAFLDALADAVAPPGAGHYYATSELTPAHVLTGTQVERKLAEARRRLGTADQDIAVLLVIETLKRLGPVNFSGLGLRQTLDLYLPAASKPLCMPFLEKVAEIRSDGAGKFWFKVRPDPGLGGAARFEIPSEQGDPQKFLIKGDFTLQLQEEPREDAVLTRIKIGPERVESGLMNDTHFTPVVCENVALFLDACLLGITVENRRESVVVKAIAQAKIGGIKTAVLQTIDKTAVKR